MTDIYYEGGIEDRDTCYLKVLSPSEFVMSYGRSEHYISEDDQKIYVGTYKGFKIYRDYGEYYYYKMVKLSVATLLAITMTLTKDRESIMTMI